MIDYLLCFPDRATAIGFGNANGYSTTDPETGETSTRLGTHDYALTIIGEHITDTGNTVDGPFGDQIPERAGDGKHWVLFRDIKETVEVPPSAEQFIIWQSDSGEDIPATAPNRRFA
jgi:hypothetical protein